MCATNANSEGAKPEAVGDKSRSVASFGIRNNVFVFAGLVSAYIFLRINSSSQPWPVASVFGLSDWQGIVGVVLLLLGSAAMLFSAILAKQSLQQRARMWLSVAFALGLSFVGCQAVQFGSILGRGIHPGILSHRAVYDRANLDWLSKLNQSVNSQIRTLDRKPRDAKTQDSLHRLVTFRSGLLKWTEAKVGRTENYQQQKMALDLLAFQIHPDGFAIDKAKSILEYAAKEHSDVVKQHAYTKAELEIANRKLSSLRAKIRESRNAKSRSETQTGEANAAEHIKQASETMATVTELTGIAAFLKNRLEATNQFELNQFELGQPSRGLRAKHDLKLPFVVPNGNEWVWCFLGLAAVHCLYFVEVLFFLIALLLKPMQSVTAEMIENVAARWHFSAIAWIILFTLLYLF